MKKSARSAIIPLILFLNLCCFAQTNSINTDQHTIDSVKTLLHAAIADTQVAKLQINIALLFRKTNIDSALTYANTALNYCKEKQLGPLEAEAYRCFGKIYQKKSDYKSALEHFYSYLKKATELNRKREMADAYQSIGNMHLYLGEYPNSLKNYLLSAKYSEEIGNKLWLANTYANIGVVQMREKSYAEAVKTYLKTIKVYMELGDSSGISACYKNIGVVYAEQGLHKQALENYFKCLEIEKKIKDDDLCSTYNNIATTYLNLGNLDESLKYWNISYDLLQNRNDDYSKFYCLQGLGNVYQHKKNYTKALEYFFICIDIAKNAGLKYEVMDSYRNLSNTYASLKDFEKAHKFERLYSTLKDSIHNEQNSEVLAEMQTKYESELKDKALIQKDAEIKIQQADSKQKSMQRNAFILGFTLMVAFAIFIFRGYRQKQRANIKISVQNKIIAEKNKGITDSINYALRIQQALLPSKEIPSHLFTDAFILFVPKDIVSGDFYWYSEKNGQKVIAAVDCTGHGVPGAFMSMIGNAFLNEIVSEKGITEPALILGGLRDLVKTSLKQKGADGETKDGMDIAVLSFNETNSLAQFAGANNPVWRFRKENNTYTLLELQPDKRPIGYFMGKGLPFTNHTIDLQKGDTLYIFTDGYADQFGGEKGKKFKYKKLKESLLDIQNRSMPEQEAFLLQMFHDWKGNLEQVDDVCIIGIRV